MKKFQLILFCALISYSFGQENVSIETYENLDGENEIENVGKINFTLSNMPEAYKRRTITRLPNGTFEILDIPIIETLEDYEAEEIFDKIARGSIVAHLENFSYQTAVLTSKTLCGGSIIRWDWVITAQHCVHGFRASDFTVRAGSKRFYKGGATRKVKHIYKHNGFTLSKLNNDIALLHLKTSFKSDSYTYPIHPIDLGTKVPKKNVINIASGFGTLSYQGKLPRFLHKTYLLLIGKTKCNQLYGGALTNSMICAGYLSGLKDTCQGDSGGPLVRNKKLIGVVSFGNGCATRGYPGVYTSVPHERSWILKILKAHS